MPRTRVRRVGPESASLLALGLWCSSCNGLIGGIVKCYGEANYFRDYRRLEAMAKLATSYIGESSRSTALQHLRTRVRSSLCPSRRLWFRCGLEPMMVLPSL